MLVTTTTYGQYLVQNNGYYT